MNIKLNSADRLRIYGNGSNEVWQDISYEPDTESLKLPLYKHGDYKIYQYTEKHQNGYSTCGIIKIPIDHHDMRIKGFKLKEFKEE